MSGFVVAPHGAVTVDFRASRPVDVLTAFAVWDSSGDQWAIKAEASQTKVGTPDFAFNPGFAGPGVLVCIFNCMLKGPPPATPLHVDVIVTQGAQSQVYSTTPAVMFPGGSAQVPVANLSIKFELPLS